MCITPRSQALRWASYLGVKLCSVHPTAESNCTPQSQNPNLWESLVVFKGTSRRSPFRGEHIYHEKKRFEEKKFDLLSLKFWIRGVMHTAESNFSNFVIEYLVEIETEFENTSTLACLSGGPDGFESWNNEGRKSCDTLPLVWHKHNNTVYRKI